jgi:hypothetical protein
MSPARRYNRRRSRYKTTTPGICLLHRLRSRRTVGEVMIAVAVTDGGRTGHRLSRLVQRQTYAGAIGLWLSIDGQPGAQAGQSCLAEAIRSLPGRIGCCVDLPFPRGIRSRRTRPLRPSPPVPRRPARPPALLLLSHDRQRVSAKAVGGGTGARTYRPRHRDPDPRSSQAFPATHPPRGPLRRG